MTAFVNGGITDTAKKSNLDSKYGPYESVHAAYTALTSPTDYVVVGLTVGIQTNDGIVEYWFQNGTNESDLVLKVPTVDVPVQSVNGETGDVVLDYTNVGAAATVHTHTVSDITNFPSLATVATSGNYSDLNGTPTLATVATTGSYSDLTNKPTIPAAQVQTDWDAESGISSIANKPTLATVATSGSYADLSNKPEIPAAQIQSDWGQTDSSKKDFIKNKPTIPSAQVQSNWAETDQTAKSFIQNKPSLATVATTGAYSDLTGTPTIPAAQVQTDWNASSGMGVLLNKPTLATVATSGSYNDLTNRPNIPAAQVQADWTESDTSSMAYIAHKPTIPAAQVQSDWNQTNTSAPDYIKNKPAIAGNVQSDWTENDSTDPAYIQHKPTLAAVATSGDYEDLSNTPTIPTSLTDLDDYEDAILKEGGNIIEDAINIDYAYGRDPETFDTLTTQISLGAEVDDDDRPHWNIKKDGFTAIDILGDGYVDFPTGIGVPGAQIDIGGSAEFSNWLYLHNQTVKQEGDALTSVYSDLSENSLQVSMDYNGTQVDILTASVDTDIALVNVAADVSFSGSTSGISYNDLDDKPVIPTAVQSDWNQSDSTAPDYIKNKPNIVGQAQSDWTENDSSSPAYILHKPTLANVATSGSYNDLSNKPTIPAAQVQTDWNASSGMGVILNKPSLATVATSGSYNDLSNKPTIPSIAGCELTANKVTSLTAQSTDTQYPSAKCVYDIVGNIESALTTILGV